MKYLFSISDYFESKSAFLTTSLTLGILSSTVARAAVVGKLEILSISILTSFILA